MEVLNENKEGFKETKLGWIPDDWKIIQLNEIGEIINGLTYSPNDIHDDGVLVLRSSNIQNGKLSYKDNVYVNTGKYNPVKENDILICVRNGSKNLIGKNTLITKEIGNVAFGAFMTIYRSVHNGFISQVFKTDFFKKEVYKNLGATINSINGSDLKKFKIPFPPLPEQQKIAAILSKWDELIEQQTQLIAAKEKRKKGLMQKLLTGEVRFPEFSGEWESVELNVLVKKSKGNIVLQNEDKKGRPVIDTTSFEGEPRMYSADDKAIECQKTDVLLLWDGSKAGKAMTGKVGIVGSTFSVLKPNSKIDNNYLCYHLIFNEGRIMNVREGSGIPHVPKDFLDWYKISLPSVEEQKKTTSLLMSLSEEIKSLKDELGAMQNQKKGLMQQLLTGKIRVKV